MGELELIFPDENYQSEVELFKQVMIDNGSRMDGCGSLRVDDFTTWLSKSRDYKEGKNMPSFMKPYIQYICVRKADNKVVGMFQIRYKEISQVFGNIGYCVAFDERRKGYGKKMLALGIIKCKELGLDKVMVNCLVDNEASRKCILANNGVLLDKMYVEEKNYDIERYIINID